MQEGSGGAVAVYPIPAALMNDLIDNMVWLQHIMPSWGNAVPG